MYNNGTEIQLRFPHKKRCSVRLCLQLFLGGLIKRCSVRLYLQLFVGGLLSYLRYLCLFAYSGGQHICFVFLFCLPSSCVGYTYGMLSVSLVCPFLIGPSIFSNVDLQQCRAEVWWCLGPTPWFYAPRTYIYNNNFIAKQETLTGCANYNK